MVSTAGASKSRNEMANESKWKPHPQVYKSSMQVPYRTHIFVFVAVAATFLCSSCRSYWF